MDEWGQINRVGAVVSSVITALTLGVQPAFVQLVGGSVGGTSTYLQVLVQTAPLTIAVTTISLAFMKRWFKDFGTGTFISAVILLFSIWIGRWLGGLSGPPLPQGGTFTLVAFYWEYYGPAYFLSSVTLGVFLGWVFTKLWPQPISRTRAASA